MSEDLLIRVIGDDSSYSAVMRKVQNTIRQAAGTQKEFGHSGVTSVQAVSASLRVAQGDFTNLIRAAERFVAQSQALSAVAKTIFPAIGAIAIGEIFAHGIEEVVKFIETAQKAPEKIQQSFRAMSLEIETSTEGLRIHTLQTHDAINKLLGRPPENGVKIALEEAKKEADELATSLYETQQRLETLMKDNKISTAQSIAGAALTGKGQASTAPYAGAINSYTSQMFDISYQLKQAQDAGNKVLVDSLNKQLQDKLASFNQWSATAITTLNTKQTQHGRYDYSGAVNTIEGARLAINDRFTANQAKQADDKTNQQLKTLEDEKAAASAQMQKYRDQFQQMKDDAANSVLGLPLQPAVIIDYWKSVEDAFKQGGALFAEEVREAQQNVDEAIKSANEKIHESITKGMTEWKAGVKADAEQFDSMNKLADSLHASDAKAFIDESKTNITPDISKIQEVQIQIAAMTGTITKNAAAQQMAALHAREYAAAIQNINFQLQNNNLTQEERDKLNKEKNTADTEFAVQSAQDQREIYSSPVRDALNQLVNEWTDMSQQIASVVTSTMDNINSSLSSALVAHYPSGEEFRRGVRNSLASSIRGGASGLLDTGFKGIEGTVLGKFGLGGKPDGSQNKPFWVKDAGGNGGGSGSSSASSFLSKIPFIGKLFGGGASPFSAINGTSDPLGLNGWSDSSSSVGDGGMGSNSIFGSLFQGGFAGGGDFVANRPLLVGENGPEIVNFGSGGHVTPNHALGGDTHNWNIPIDARGSTDPAAVEAGIHRAMSQWAPKIVGASLNAANEKKARTPASARRS